MMMLTLWYDFEFNVSRFLERVFKLEGELMTGVADSVTNLSPNWIYTVSLWHSLAMC